ncbi:MAG TPA: IPT/TIG domain-containing protein, partial [Acidimicrobiales bacterium]|nr:IPT/TIG domain-containing protein [Acidimicrobiales bacterium]
MRAVAGTALVVASTVALIVLPQAVAGANGVVPPSNPSANLPPQVKPACTLTPVDDHSAGCIDSILHNINYARSLEGLGPLVLPSNYASQTVTMQQLILTDEERGDRGLTQFSGLDAQLNTAALAGAQTSQDPSPPSGYHYSTAQSIFAQDYTPLGADFAWMYDDGYGGTNLLCASSASPDCWGHRNAILGPWTATGTTTPQMGAGDTANGQYAQIFANQANPADSLVDTLDPTALPTPATASAPDVVQVLPASSSSTAAGTSVTIEGNYFGTATTPTVDFGGVPATSVHVNWDGELTADAPADPAGTSAATVAVTVTTTAGSSSSTGVAQVNEFTWAPASAPTISSISPASGSELACGSITITGTNFNAGATPIVDFGTVASIGSMSYTSSSITTTIPEAVSPGTVNVTVTTPAGTTPVSGADSYVYTSSGSTDAPCITTFHAATFAAGSPSSSYIVARGTPAVTSITDTAFSGCTPSALPSDISLVYTSGSIAMVEGTPSTSDNSSYTIC